MNTPNLSSEDYHSLEVLGMPILVRKDWEDELLSLLDIEKAGELIVQHPDRMVRRVDTPRGVVYIKALYNTPEHTLLRRTRHQIRDWALGPLVIRLFQLHLELLKAGIKCAEPLLAESKGDVQFFITKELPGIRLDKVLKATSSPEERREPLHYAAEAIAKLHEAGLDNDRTAKRSGWLLTRAARRNYIQFCSRLLDLPVATEEEVRLVLAQAKVTDEESLLEDIRNRHAELHHKS